VNYRQSSTTNEDKRQLIHEEGRKLEKKGNNEEMKYERIEDER